VPTDPAAGAEAAAVRALIVFSLESPACIF